jgi:hypothetical protein
MAHLQYYNYEKAGRINSETYGYSQVVRVGDILETSGQGKQLLCNSELGSDT